MAPPPLITAEQLLSRMTTPPAPERVDGILIDASAAVRAYTGQLFTLAETTDRLVVDRGTVRLPQRPVLDVSAVADMAGVPVEFEWNGLDRVTVGLAVAPVFVATAVDVTSRHGYEETPDDVVGVVSQIAARGLGASPEQGRLTGLTLDGYAEQYGTIGAAGPFGLFPDEQAILDRYRRAAGVAWMS